MKADKIKSNIEANKELYSAIIKQYSVDTFMDDCKRYISAIKQGRIICNIESVSRSGMSRNIKFLECAKTRSGFRYLQFWSFFKALGFTETPSRNNGWGRSETFRIHGCGMDMIFHTNYTIIHKLHRLGFMTKKECDKLAQLTPQTI
jgi:hypothetical protein